MALLVSAILAYATDAGGQTPPVKAGTPAGTPPPRPVQLDRNAGLILTRSVLTALQQANQTGNYSVFYALCAPDFQKGNSPEKLATSFARLRAKNFDLSGVLVIEPQLTVAPEIYPNGVLRYAGFFPSVPMQVVFELQFAPVAGQWKLIAIAVDVVGATPVAPVEATPNPALASSYTPTPSPKSTPTSSATAKSMATAAPTPTPSPTPTPASSKSHGGVEVRPTKRGTPKSSPSSQLAAPKSTP